ncbi:hypothetical protein KR009_008911 [Drosophila setifemur]|nr:hypothetical protein KR009_008911 [Drosophila setifemur]
MIEYQLNLSYLICAPVFLILIIMCSYYCYLTVRECSRSRGREISPLLPNNIQQEQVY